MFTLIPPGVREYHRLHFAPCWPNGDPYPDGLRLRELFALAKFWHEHGRCPDRNEYNRQFFRLAMTASDRTFAANFCDYPV